MDRLGQLQKPPKGLKCADWETAALNSQRNSSSRSLKEILELQSISLHAPSTDARLHESRGQMHEVDQALARHKEHYANEEKQFRVKEAQLKEKEAQLQLQLNRFNKFVDTNEDKRRRAEKRAAAEREIIREKEKTIVTLKVAVEQMEAKEQKLEAGVKRYRKFKEFLSAVMHVRDEFQEISDMMSRYDLLQSVNGTLVKKETDINRRADKIRSSYQMYKKQAANAILQARSSGRTTQPRQRRGIVFRQVATVHREFVSTMHRATAKHSTCQPPCQAPAPTTGVSMLPRRRITTTEVNHSPPRPASPSGDGSLETSNRSVAKSSVNMVAAPLSGTSARIPGKEGTTHQPANGSVGSEKEGQETGDGSESKAVNREAAMQLHATVGSTLASGKIRYAAQSPKKAESALETPQPARGKRRDAKQSEKGGNAEEQDEQKQLCDDAVQMLGVIEYYVKDFRDICDTLTKNVVEFVTLRDVYAMKGSGGSVGGAGSSDALSSGSSRRFMSRTRGQLSAGPTSQLNRTMLN
uniref:DUF4200 domain-containing protein n=1 Tax=Toxoplasma gondii (strain ATCC 50861 / VEG) TaxID=432359 RepID=A0A0F7UQC0_TOXGV|nr:TPA: hypothetical protein BN1205_056620 [Toxoplasma gondii VEG]